MSSYCLVIIPARMSSTRLPGKPLADIAGYPMVVHVALRARAAKLGRIVIATDSPDIKSATESHGFEVIMTREDHESGSDRIYEALAKIDPNGRFNVIINLQSDLPTISPESILSTVHALTESPADIATLCSKITYKEEKNDPNVVKIVGTPLDNNRLRALYFTRAKAPYGHGPFYHHIGLYVYRRKALKRFVSLGPSILEKREKLEQLRALEDNMRIDVSIIKTAPFNVDTQEDLTRIRTILKNKSLYE
ncbi:MAG: 3-deoxy-manno-octulosonate cytidylyltransferase (CMP-KDO synthetase) [Candidatus Tokpelaia sp. JSC188]|nr:MAG: 3-deoxy-manno-octulosonate cytidylyltransferase (CMP-KDO synthetase) [Candidatus Tokpelaia sp. JSC188]